MKKKRDPAQKKSTKSYPSHYAGILLEEIRDQVKTVAEAVDLTREELSQKIEEGERRLEQKIDDASMALGKRIDGVETELSDLKIELSEKMDKIGGRLDRHDQEIQELKKVQNLG